MKRRKPRSERKTVTIMVRVTAEQKEAFAAAAKRAGLDLAPWARMIALRETAAPPLSTRRSDLLAKLVELQRSDDPEAAHSRADDLLLAYLDDSLIAEAYSKITRWCA